NAHKTAGRQISAISGFIGHQFFGLKISVAYDTRVKRRAAGSDQPGETETVFDPRRCSQRACYRCPKGVLRTRCPGETSRRLEFHTAKCRALNFGSCREADAVANDA